MNRLRRAAVTACILSLGFALAGCEGFDFDKITNLLDTKKPLPGDRKALFPEGVPGVEQGVPPELQRGRQNAAAEPTGSVEETKQAAVAEPEKPAKPKAKPKPRKKVAAAPPQQSTAAAPAAAAQPAGTPWPSSQPAAQAAPAPGAAPWPSAPPTGTFSR
jgi:outer membrane biosynthesis protein TonB